MSLLANTSANAVVQLLGYAVPLLTLPYLTRSLGASTYGEVAYALAAGQLCLILTDYGFQVAAAGTISSLQGRRDDISRYVSAVYAIKLVLLLPAALALLSLAFGTALQTRPLMLAVTISVAAQTFQPSWLFAGLEKSAKFALATLTGRLLYCASVFIFVSTPGDSIKVLLLSGLSHLIILLLAFVSARRLGVRLVKVNRVEVFRVASETFAFFKSRSVVSAQSALPAVILGMTSTPASVAAFSIGDQLYRACHSVFGAFSQTLYPFMVRTKNRAVFSRALLWCILLAALATVGAWTLGPIALDLFFGDITKAILPTLKVLFLGLAPAVASSLLGYPFLGALGRADLANRTNLLGGMGMLVVLFFLWVSNSVSPLTLAFAILGIEVSVASVRAILASRLHST